MVDICDQLSDDISQAGFLFRDNYFDDSDIDHLALQCGYHELESDSGHCLGCLCQGVMFPSPDIETGHQKSGKHLTQIRQPPLYVSLSMHCQ